MTMQSDSYGYKHKKSRDVNCLLTNLLKTCCTAYDSFANEFANVCEFDSGMVLQTIINQG